VAVSDAKYLFVWDKKAHRVVASYYVAPVGADPRAAPTDVTHGAVPAREEEARIDALRQEYPIDRYTFAGGYAPSLAVCVEGFLGMEKDYHHFFEEPMVRDEAAAVAERHLNRAVTDPRDELVVLTESAVGKPYGWVFFYQTRMFLETGDHDYLLAGNGPVVVKHDGTVHTLGSARPPGEEIADFEARHNLR
jgi:hypothetical protein